MIIGDTVAIFCFEYHLGGDDDKVRVMTPTTEAATSVYIEKVLF
jgi:hypothetical protein